MSRRLRAGIAFTALLVVLGTLLIGLAGLPDFGTGTGPYASFVIDHAVRQRHVTNLVSSVMFDYRGMDTMIEEFILFGAVMGVALLLRSSRRVQAERPPDLVTSDAVRLLGARLVPVVVLVGLWLMAFGYITPGGGFQGGVVVSGGFTLLWLTGSYLAFRTLTPSAVLDAVEGFGAAGYVVVGLLGIAAGAPFLTNTLALGSPGTLLSGGSIAVLNWVAGIEVAAAFVLMNQEFLEEYVQTFGSVEEEP